MVSVILGCFYHSVFNTVKSSLGYKNGMKALFMIGTPNEVNCAKMVAVILAVCTVGGSGDTLPPYPVLWLLPAANHGSWWKNGSSFKRNLPNKKTAHHSLSGNKSHTDSVCFFHLFNVTYCLMFIDVSQGPPAVPKWSPDHRALQGLTVPIGSSTHEEVRALPSACKNLTEGRLCRSKFYQYLPTLRRS